MSWPWPSYLSTLGPSILSSVTRSIWNRFLKISPIQKVFVWFCGFLREKKLICISQYLWMTLLWLGIKQVQSSSALKGVPREKNCFSGTTYTTPSPLLLKDECILQFWENLLNTYYVQGTWYLLSNNLQKKTENSCFSILFQSKDTDSDSLSHS